MTREQKKMWGFITAAIATIGVFIATVIFAAGGQNREVGFNTERIKRVERAQEIRFNKIDKKLDKHDESFEKISESLQELNKRQSNIFYILKRNGKD